MQIEIFGTKTCADCFRTKAFLKENGLEFIFYDIEESDERLQEALALANGQTETPVIWVDKTAVLINPSREALEKYFL